jgi:hypothetical protein
VHKGHRGLFILVRDSSLFKKGLKDFFVVAGGQDSVIEHADRPIPEQLEALNDCFLDGFYSSWSVEN